MQFLNEELAPHTISQMLKKASIAKIAVAFWGIGAAERLGIDKRTGTTQIICNLESGACNPMEIERLLALAPNVVVRMHPSLHAKVYWSTDAVVIGSSNASANGLAIEGDELKSWREANVVLNNSVIIDDTQKWFDKLFAESLHIDADDIAAAKHEWKRRHQARPKSVIDAFRATSAMEKWQRVKVSYWSELASQEAEDRLSAIKEKTGQNDLSAYEDWQENLTDGDYVLDFQMKGDDAKYQGLWLIVPNPTTFTNLSLTKKEMSFSRDFGFVVVTPEDRQKIASAAKHFLSGETDVLVQFSEVIAYLDTPHLTMRSDDARLKAAFHKEMRKIYEDAKKAGYTASYLLSSLASVGGYETAKLFVGKQGVTTGFYKLIELGRPELTIEHLTLQEQWRSLFSAELLAMAAQRLESVKR